LRLQAAPHFGSDAVGVRSGIDKEDVAFASVKINGLMA
jgi:hypothetical protein